MVTEKTRTWDVIQEHAIAKELDAETQLALVCEYLDLYDELQGVMSLSEFIDANIASDAGGLGAEPEAEPDPEPEPEAEAEAIAAPSSNGDTAADDLTDGEPRPPSMKGMQVVYRIPGRNVLSDKTGVISDANGLVSFTDIDGEPWSNLKRTNVYPINPVYFREIHISKREAREFNAWLSGTLDPNHPEGALLRCLHVEFDDHPDKCAFAIVNGKKPYVDRFVQLPDNGFEDDQKPTTKLFGDHCFRVRGKDWVIRVVTP